MNQINQTQREGVCPMGTKKYLSLLLVSCTLLLLGSQASAVLINFDDQGLTGPSTFGNPMQTINLTNVGGSGVDVTFSGGIILTNATNFPANNTSVYGTYGPGNTYTNPMKITFSQNINNFFMDLYNGWTSDRTFSVYDDLGNSTIVTLPPNTSSGQTLIAFAAAGEEINIEDVTLGVESWDFLIDNIHFNEALPSVPEPTTLLLLGLGLLGLEGMRKKIKPL